MASKKLMPEMPDMDDDLDDDFGPEMEDGFDSDLDDMGEDEGLSAEQNLLAEAMGMDEEQATALKAFVESCQ